MIQLLDEDNFLDFKNYCIEHRSVHDESFLYDEDLDDFEIGDDNPTCLLYGESGLEGVCSIMQDAHHLKGKKARVRIFHCKHNRQEDYKLLLEKVLPLNARVEKLTMFVPNGNLTSKTIIETMDFLVERYSFVMERNDKAAKDFTFPEGYTLSDFVSNRDEEDYLYVRNTAFANILGSETPHTLEQVKGYMSPDQILLGVLDWGQA